MFRIIRRIKNLRKSLLVNEHLLERGSYRYDFISRVFYKNETRTKEYVHTYLRDTIGGFKEHQRSWFRLVIYKFLNFIIRYKVDNISNDGMGTVLFDNDRVIKIFDINKMNITTFFESKKKLKSYLVNVHYFEQFFLVPSIHNVQIDEMFIVEELILYIPYGKMTRDQKNNLIKMIFINEIKYSSNNKEKHKTNSLTLTNKFKAKYPSLVNLFPENIFDLNIELANNKQKGDLWLANIMYKDERIYYIDFEHSNEHLFIYDIFFFLNSSRLYNNNKDYSYSYFSGDYDKHFSILFSCYGLKYDENLRTEYYYLSLIDQFLNGIIETSIEDVKVKIIEFNEFSKGLGRMKYPRNVNYN